MTFNLIFRNARIAGAEDHTVDIGIRGGGFAAIEARLADADGPAPGFGRPPGHARIGGNPHAVRSALHHQEAKRLAGLCCWNDANVCRETRFAIFTGLALTT
jgi:hypothetical protein